jgi:hypothetical protein
MYNYLKKQSSFSLYSSQGAISAMLLALLLAVLAVGAVATPAPTPVPTTPVPTPNAGHCPALAVMLAPLSSPLLLFCPSTATAARDLKSCES